MELNSMDDHSANAFAHLAPMLDEAVNKLSAEDRAAVILRFFEQRDFRAVGEMLGSSEDAARKRVSGAIGLHSSIPSFAPFGVTCGS